MKTASQVVFRVGTEKYGVDIDQAGMIEAGVTGQKLPGMPACVRAFFELRGELIPIVSLRDRFHKPQRPEDEIYDFIVSDACGFKVAYEVDAVEKIIDSIEEQKNNDTKMLIRSENNYMKQVINSNGLIVLMNLAHILSEEEQKELKDFLKKSKEDADK